MKTSRLAESGISVLPDCPDDEPIAKSRFADYESRMTQSEANSIFSSDARPLSIAFVVISGSSLMSVASAIDPLRAANRVSGGTVFDWTVTTPDGKPAATTCGMPIASDGRFDTDHGREVVIFVGGFGSRFPSVPGLLRDVSRAARTARAVGGVESGAWLLGRAGLLEGRAATTHWEDLEDFATAFPGTDVRPDRYVIDGPVFTTGGASPTFDLMLHLIQSRLGMAVALDVASIFIYDQSRQAADAQPLVSLGRLDNYSPRLAQAVRLMESHVDAPLTTGAIARRAGVTTRTLEKTFLRAIGETPGAYYLRLRLNVARRLVLDTAEPMADIAVRTGFSSAAAFSRAFSRAFGSAPVRLRRG
jgi:transcriptional regulator GlxA family with amidase domain